MDFLPFIKYCKKHIKGDEKGEAQIFLDHFFTALGYVDGLRDAGANCEYRVTDTIKHTTSFADLVWKPRVLIEMKKKGEDLSIHYQQAFSYWLKLVPNRPTYVMLCNFDEFWIYDFDKDIYEPQERVFLGELNERREAFTFLTRTPKKPLFKTDKEDVTEKVAYFIAVLYRSLIDKNRDPVISKKVAMHYSLQCVLCLFAEDIDLLKEKIFTRLIQECSDRPGSGYDKIPETYDLISGLFREMNTQGITPSGRFKGVDYFNGGLFEKIQPVELTMKEVELLDVACTKNWRHINPAIFGTIFEQGMEKSERHILGAHYTHETDIKKIVDPVIVQPWKRKIEDIIQRYNPKIKQESIDRLFSLHTELTNFKVLDPACGSGNFLFIAYKEMKLLEKEILSHIARISSELKITGTNELHKHAVGVVSTKQFYGIDINPFAVELARVTLMIAKEISIKDSLDNQETLPLDNLDDNIVCADALFTNWPEVDAIIGNPPFQSHANMKREFGIEYVNQIWESYPEISGKADFSVYWFYKTHQQLKDGCYAGLVGTNTIRQNYSRHGSLDYIVRNNGTIVEAISSQPWSGSASVHVSLVCWKKGIETKPKNLYHADTKGQLTLWVVDQINTSLSLSFDVVTARVIHANQEPKTVYKGQMAGHEGFFLSISEAKKILKDDPRNHEVIKPVLIGNDLIGNHLSQPSRFVIDFSGMDIINASSYSLPFKIVLDRVKEDRELKSKKQVEENKEAVARNPTAKVAKHHIGFYNRWWQLGYGLREMIEIISTQKRYIVCSRVSLRPIFEFVSREIRPNDALVVFCFEDDYSFGIIQSKFHWEWWKAKCSTLEGRYRYTSETVWDTFPWPQNPTKMQIADVARASHALRIGRTELMKKYNMTFRDLYPFLDEQGSNPLKELHEAVDQAVLRAYGFIQNKDILTQLLELNLILSRKENVGEIVQAPGLPTSVNNKNEFISDDCLKFEWNVI